MSFLIDTSVLVNLMKDRTGLMRQLYDEAVGEEPVFLTRITQMELLRGAKSTREWGRLQSYLDAQTYVPFEDTLWVEAARIYFDLRRQGLTVRASLDCCIAEIAMRGELTLLHDDRDYLAIKQVRDLKEQRLARV